MSQFNFWSTTRTSELQSQMDVIQSTAAHLLFNGTDWQLVMLPGCPESNSLKQKEIHKNYSGM